MIPVSIHLTLLQKMKKQSFSFYLYYLISLIFTTLKRSLLYYYMHHKESQHKQPQIHHPKNRQPSNKHIDTSSLFYNNQSQSDDLFQLEYHTMKKLRLPIHRKISKGAWTLQQNKVYLDFLIKNKESFCSESVRRESRVFCRLSEILHKKRTPDQCRGHHQKLVGKEDQSVDILINKLIAKIAETQKQKKLKIKTRIIGKYRKHKPKIQPKIENDREDSSQILRVDKRAFCKITTFKNSSQILIQIEEDAIQSYSLT